MKIPDSLQYEVWAPEGPGRSFPKRLVYVGFDRDEAIAEVDRLCGPNAIGPLADVDLMIVVGQGFDVYEITAADLKDTT